jgi:hypothetical protein
MVRVYGPKSKRLLFVVRAVERALMWALGGDCPLVGAKVGEAKVCYVGEGDNPGLGVGAIPSPTQ